jgi:antitoxin ChpS
MMKSQAVLAFKDKVVQKYPVTEALLFGSRARRSHHSQSDADVAIILAGQKGKFLETKLEMADWAVEVLMDTIKHSRSRNSISMKRIPR